MHRVSSILHPVNHDSLARPSFEDLGLFLLFSHPPSTIPAVLCRIVYVLNLAEGQRYDARSGVVSFLCKFRHREGNMPVYQPLC